MSVTGVYQQGVMPFINELVSVKIRLKSSNNL